jgi:competence ComEA-like helix-hairpin-helix protein
MRARAIVVWLGVLMALNRTEVRWPRRVPAELALAQGEPGSRAVLLGGRLDVNQATAEELETLPGIGPARARAIVAEVRRRGRVERLDELAGAPGLGPATIDRLRPFVTPE